jgi:NitT/TauT family transport system permease protein
MFQEPALLPWLTASKNVELPLRLQGVSAAERKQRAQELLSLVHLERAVNQRPHELSGGMRQRVALARALAQGSGILLMDEPFAALDAVTRDILHEELIRVWQETGVTVIFVTHNVREAVRLGQRVLLMSSRPGRIIKEWKVEVPEPRRIEDEYVSKLAGTITAELREEIRRDTLQIHRDVAQRRQWWKKVVPPLLSIALVLVIWQWAFNQEFKEVWVLPSPGMVWDALKLQWDAGFVSSSIANSLKRAVVGFAMSVAIGVPLGVLVARVSFIRATFGPLLSGLQQLPSVAWVPAAVIWFGLTDQAIYVVVLLGAVPSIANGLVAGIDQIPPLYLRAGRVMGANGWSSVRHILLPASLPGFLAGLEQGWAFAWRSLMAAELIAVSPQLGPGLGQLLQIGRELGDMALVIGTILVILMVGIVVERFFFAPLRRKVLRNRGIAV